LPRALKASLKVCFVPVIFLSDFLLQRFLDKLVRKRKTAALELAQNESAIDVVRITALEYTPVIDRRTVKEHYFHTRISGARRIGKDKESC
jgi:hypothetical protein